MIALVTDSGAQLPEGLRDRFDVRVVPLGVVVDGAAFREGVDLDVDDFYRSLDAGATVSTAAPSPAEVLDVFEEAAAVDVSAILSVHTGSDVSAVVQAVRVAAASSPVPVEIVDSRTASFAVGCCVWGAGEVLAHGGSVDGAANAAREIASRVGNVFVVNGLRWARRGGRLDPAVGDEERLPVLALTGGRMHEVGRADDADDAVALMAAHIRDASGGSRQHIGVGDAQVPALGDRLATRLELDGSAQELVRYRVGPSVGAHTGTGTFGACYFTPGRARRPG